MNWTVIFSAIAAILSAIATTCSKINWTAIGSMIAAFLSAVAAGISAYVARSSYKKQDEEAEREPKIYPIWFSTGTISPDGNHSDKRNYLSLYCSVLNRSSKPLSIDCINFIDSDIKYAAQKGFTSASNMDFLSDSMPLLLSPYSKRDFIITFRTDKNQNFKISNCNTDFNFEFKYNDNEEWVTRKLEISYIDDEKLFENIAKNRNK
ncbi:hypothetical protein [Lactobacillus sp. ESL0703]|uniref:hypothetical protein n=1 Tax=Lactobacillus sp. ESL0703 TaxID=2983218 RepID=UPI0023F71BA6|nr:hypothetical protein [Lactobacillus sp. ESL0703]MDF7668506.1 hypothetical protein [Lactobacillus sp. ESL0703]